MKRKHSSYLVGIKGVAMTALAVYLKEKGWLVEGSDTKEIFPTDMILRKLGITVKLGFREENLRLGPELLIATGAHGGFTNPEVKKAIDLGIPSYMHGKYLGMLMEGKDGISVAGCHGKTTTSSMIASLLMNAGMDPSYLVGTAYINELGPAGHYGKSSLFIAESDEYVTCPITDRTPRFLWQQPRLLVLTNIEYDHPDAYRDLEEVKEAYLAFTGNLKDDGLLIGNADNREVVEILKRSGKRYLTYGFSPQADYRVNRLSFSSERTFVEFSHKNISLGEYMLKVPGRHNVANALAASICANLVGIGWDKLKVLLKGFTGTKRRFEKIYEAKGVSLYDDYAHHPSEIKATLSSAKLWFPERRLIVIFQPHTYSRTKSLMDDFAKAFIDADLVLVPDIYPSARESFDPFVTSQKLVEKAKVLKNNIRYSKDLKETLRIIGGDLRQGDIIMTMGAGDVYLSHDEIIGVIKKTKI